MLATRLVASLPDCKGQFANRKCILAEAGDELFGCLLGRILLLVLRDVGLGQYECFARNYHYPLIRATVCTWRQFACGLSRYVFANDGEIARFELEKVRAALKAGCSDTGRVRIRANSAQEHTGNIRQGCSSVKRHKEANQLVSRLAGGVGSVCEIHGCNPDPKKSLQRRALKGKRLGIEIPLMPSSA